MNPIYAKSIANSSQLNTRHEWFQQKEKLVDGVEVLLLPRDFKELKATERILLEAKKKFGKIALEAPDCIEKGGIDPVSSNAGIRAYSQEFLDAFTKLADAVGSDYAQYQLMRGKFGEDGVPLVIFAKERNMKDLSAWHNELQGETKTPLQIENTIPLNPEGSAEKVSELHYEPNTTRLREFEKAKIPAAYDTAHAMSTIQIDAFAQSAPSNHTKVINGKTLYAVKTEIGICYVELDKTDRVNAQIVVALARDFKGAYTYPEKAAITWTMSGDIMQYSDIIGSIQLQNAQGFGISKGDHGRLDGMLDLEQLCKSIPSHIPIIPEVTETDYLKPENQKTLLHKMHEWLKTA